MFHALESLADYLELTNWAVFFPFSILFISATLSESNEIITKHEKKWNGLKLFYFFPHFY